MTDVWVCSTCHSINRQRGSRCYKCGAKQEQGSAVLADVRTQAAIQTRALVPYRRSILRAIIAAAFIVAYAVLGVVVLFESLPAVQYLRDQTPIILQTGRIDQGELFRLASRAVVPALLQTVCGIGALLFFAAWLSRVIMNVPALGGGTPGATPTKAFIYPLIPFWNLFKTPPMIQDALYRLDPRAGGFFMILVAWIGLVGSAIIGFIAGWWVNLRLATVVPGSSTLGEAIDVVVGAYDMQVLITIVTTLMASLGAIVLVMVMFRIESRASARDREIRAAAFAPRAEPGTVEARPGGVSWEAAAAGGVAMAMTAPAPDPVQARGVTAATGGSVSALLAVPDPAGPRLIVTVESGGRIVAELDGESEVVSLADLQDAAAPLARAGGTAIVTAADGADAHWTAREIAQALRASGVATTFED